MTNEIKNIIRLYESGEDKNKRLAAAFLASLPFDYLLEFCRHFARPLIDKISSEKIPVSSSYEFDFIVSDLVIIADNAPELSAVVVSIHINDEHVFNLIENKNVLQLKADNKSRKQLIKIPKMLN